MDWHWRAFQAGATFGNWPSVRATPQCFPFHTWTRARTTAMRGASGAVPLVTPMPSADGDDGDTFDNLDDFVRVMCPPTLAVAFEELQFALTVVNEPSQALTMTTMMACRAVAVLLRTDEEFPDKPTMESDGMTHNLNQAFRFWCVHCGARVPRDRRPKQPTQGSSVARLTTCCAEHEAALQAKLPGYRILELTNRAAMNIIADHVGPPLVRYLLALHLKDKAVHESFALAAEFMNSEASMAVLPPDYKQALLNLGVALGALPETRRVADRESFRKMLIIASRESQSLTLKRGMRVLWAYLDAVEHRSDLYSGSSLNVPGPDNIVWRLCSNILAKHPEPPGHVTAVVLSHNALHAADALMLALHALDAPGVVQSEELGAELAAQARRLLREAALPAPEDQPELRRAVARFVLHEAYSRGPDAAPPEELLALLPTREQDGELPEPYSVLARAALTGNAAELDTLPAEPIARPDSAAFMRQFLARGSRKGGRARRAELNELVRKYKSLPAPVDCLAPAELQHMELLLLRRCVERRTEEAQEALADLLCHELAYCVPRLLAPLVAQGVSGADPEDDLAEFPRDAAAADYAGMVSVGDNGCWLADPLGGLGATGLPKDGRPVLRSQMHAVLAAVAAAVAHQPGDGDVNVHTYFRFGDARQVMAAAVAVHELRAEAPGLAGAWALGSALDALWTGRVLRHLYDSRFVPAMRQPLSDDPIGQVIAHCDVGEKHKFWYLMPLMVAAESGTLQTKLESRRTTRDHPWGACLMRFHLYERSRSAGDLRALIDNLRMLVAHPDTTPGARKALLPAFVFLTAGVAGEELERVLLGVTSVPDVEPADALAAAAHAAVTRALADVDNAAEPDWAVVTGAYEMAYTYLVNPARPPGGDVGLSASASSSGGSPFAEATAVVRLTVRAAALAMRVDDDGLAAQWAERVADVLTADCFVGVREPFVPMLKRLRAALPQVARRPPGGYAAQKAPGSYYNGLPTPKGVDPSSTSPENAALARRRSFMTMLFDGPARAARRDAPRARWTADGADFWGAEVAPDAPAPAEMPELEPLPLPPRRGGGFPSGFPLTASMREMMEQVD